MPTARGALAGLGRFARERAGFVLAGLGAAAGVALEAVRPASWRRTGRLEFRRALTQSAGGGLASTMFVAALSGIATVREAIYWLGLAGLGKLTAPVLVAVLLRELAPVLVGVILLGRSGLLAVVELGTLDAGGRARAMVAEGLDPFSLLVVPRVVAFATAGFTLGIAFSFTALLAGFLATEALGGVTGTASDFLAFVLDSMTVGDFVLIPLKFVFIAFGVGLVSVLSGLRDEADATPERRLPRGFARGMLVLMAIDVAFTVASG